MVKIKIITLVVYYQDKRIGKNNPDCLLNPNETRKVSSMVYQPK